MSDDAPLLHRMLAVLLRYPDDSVLDHLDDITAALPALRRRADRDRIGALAVRLRDLPPTRAAQDYVAVFDHDRHRSLHLTYYRHGDTRGRGMALLALKDAYRRAGHPPPEDELPDYLPLMLEFAALSPVNGRRLLADQRPALELLRQALHTPRGARAAGAAGPERPGTRGPRPAPAADPYRAAAQARRAGRIGPPAAPPEAPAEEFAEESAGGLGDRPGSGLGGRTGAEPAEVTEATAHYAAALDALCERLPALRTRQRRLLSRLADGGPPREDVGLEPFAPPAYLTGTAVPGERR